MKTLDLISFYEKALYSYRMWNYDKAKKEVNSCLRINSKDKASQVLSDKILKLNKKKGSRKISLKEIN